MFARPLSLWYAQLAVLAAAAVIVALTPPPAVVADEPPLTVVPQPSKTGPIEVVEATKPLRLPPVVTTNPLPPVIDPMPITTPPMPTPKEPPKPIVPAPPVAITAPPGTIAPPVAPPKEPAKLKGHVLIAIADTKYFRSVKLNVSDSLLEAQKLWGSNYVDGAVHVIGPKGRLEWRRDQSQLPPLNDTPFANDEFSDAYNAVTREIEQLHERMAEPDQLKVILLWFTDVLPPQKAMNLRAAKWPDPKAVVFWHGTAERPEFGTAIPDTHQLVFLKDVDGVRGMHNSLKALLPAPNDGGSR